jgi:uncharacterized protein
MARLDAEVLLLAPRHRAMLLALLRRHVPEMEVLAYGSRIHGDCHEASDLDLAVRNPAAPEQEAAELYKLKEALVESDLPIRVEVVDWARLPAAFRREIERGYVVLREGGNT